MSAFLIVEHPNLLKDIGKILKYKTKLSTCIGLKNNGRFNQKNMPERIVARVNFNIRFLIHINLPYKT